MAIPSAHPALVATLLATSCLAALPAQADRPEPGRGGFGGAPRVQPYRAPLPQFHTPAPAVRLHAPGPAVRFHGPAGRPGYWYHGHHDGIWGWWWVAGTSWLFYPQPVVVQPTLPEPVVVQPAPQPQTDNPKNLSYPTPFACSASKRCGFGGPIAARVRLRCAQQRSQTEGPSNCSAAALTQA